MVSSKLTTSSTQQAGRSQSNLDWNGPKEPSTPRGEYAFMMEDYAPVWGFQPNSNMGPFNGGVAQ
jgi:hypothetical protein